MEGSTWKSRVVSLSVFFSSLMVVLITLTSVIFPAFLVTTFGGFPNYSNVNPFETGIWAWQLIITDSVVFALTILYFKNRSPSLINRAIRFIINFEVSKELAFLTLLVILGTYISLAVIQLPAEEPWEDYYRGLKQDIQDWSPNDIGKGYTLHLKLFLLSSSLKIFGTDKVVPFMVSVSLLITTYFITAEITKKRFAGIISMLIVLQSNIFLTYQMSPTYENSWTLLYILSLYFIIKKWFLSPLSYVLSLFSKPLTVVFLPMTFFFIYDSPIPKKRKIQIFTTYGIIIIIMIMAFFFYNFTTLVANIRNFSLHDFWQGFSAFSFEFRYDGLILFFILPLIVGLGIASKRGILYANSIMILITGMLLVSSFLLALTNLTNQPYRFLPLVVFFAIGAGTLLSKSTIRSEKGE